MTDLAPTIVLVDDDVALRTALAFTLELDGFAVQAHPSGEDLLAGALPSRPACMVLDLNLPGASGLDTLQQLRRRGVDLPALLITSHPRAQTRDRAEALGAGVVEKPLLGDALVLAIRSALDAAA
jgi:FixJ family two-component response regulator